MDKNKLTLHYQKAASDMIRLDHPAGLPMASQQTALTSMRIPLESRLKARCLQTPLCCTPGKWCDALIQAGYVTQKDGGIPGHESLPPGSGKRRALGKPGLPLYGSSWCLPPTLPSPTPANIRGPLANMINGGDVHTGGGGRGDSPDQGPSSSRLGYMKPALRYFQVSF